ncbi:aromatic aminotransferase ISS1, partial [Tanacetum coccineum]
MGSYGMLAKRAVLTETPVMVQIQELLRGVKGAVEVLSGGAEESIRGHGVLERGGGGRAGGWVSAKEWVLWELGYGGQNERRRKYRRGRSGEVRGKGIGSRGGDRREGSKGAEGEAGLEERGGVQMGKEADRTARRGPRRIQELLRGVKGAVSLAQGVVYWLPPKPALEKVQKLVWEPSVSRYGADEGLPELREALTKKLREENKLCKSSVMVTAGANQAFVNIVLTLCDAGDSVVMFAPYYFNAYMSFQMTGVTNILVGPGDPNTLHPDTVSAALIPLFAKAYRDSENWLEKTLRETKPTPKLVTVVNPGNPSGTYIPEPLLKKISDICKSAGCWLVVDNTY